MKRQKIIDMLCELNALNPLECTEDIGNLLEDTVNHVSNKIDYSYEKLERIFPLLRLHDMGESIVSKYICLNYYGLFLLKESFKGTPPDDILSVQQTRNLKEAVEKMIIVGVCTNMQPLMPTYKQIPENISGGTLSVEVIKYHRLVVTLLSLLNCRECVKLHGCVFNNLKPIMSAFYQIMYCPLKIPTVDGSGSSSFTMTVEWYNKLMSDREVFTEEFKKLEKVIHIAHFVRDTMMLFHDKCPNWLKRALTHKMDALMLRKNGLRCISITLLDLQVDYNSYDRTKAWKTLNVLVKLIFKFHGTPQFESNIIPQVKDLLRNEEAFIPFEHIFVICSKISYDVDMAVFNSEFLPTFTTFFDKICSKEPEFQNEEDVTHFIGQDVRLMHAAFVLQDADLVTPVLPIELLSNYTFAIYDVYNFVLDSSLEAVKNELKDILMHFVYYGKNLNTLFDGFIFGIYPHAAITRNKHISLEIKEKEEIVIRITQEKIRFSMTTNADLIYKLFKGNDKLLFDLFVYLLQCLSRREKYFSFSHNKELLSLEETPTLEVGLERSLAAYNLLSTLSEDPKVQKLIIEQPTEIVSYFHNVYEMEIQNKTHLCKNSDSEAFHSLFVVTMVLQALTGNSDKQDLVEYGRLLPTLRLISKETSNKELKGLLEEILENLSGRKDKEKCAKPEKKSQVDEAIEMVCDPLLPVRGHGLMTLAHLIEDKEESVMERQHYILNIFQQNVNDADSYIYLNAIKGLAAMADAFPDTVLNELCEEYSDFKRSDCELRMKLGEALVRAVRALGEKASKYKALLLNTFLMGSKDEDHLIRASSLSNLGEVCRVLGYNLGSIVTEVLACVHDILTTDKAVEARRAAVSVFRMLFAGLEIDMVTFLKDDILEIYRTLKNIYYNDPDDVTRLQAQLALEELNENVKKIMIAPPSLLFDKNILKLN